MSFLHDILICGYENDNLLIYMCSSIKIAEHIVNFPDFVKGYYSKYCQEDICGSRGFFSEQ